MTWLLYRDLPAIQNLHRRPLLQEVVAVVGVDQGVRGVSQLC